MFNLTVDEAHTFFVGDGAWLVHNTCKPTKEQVRALKDLGLDAEQRRTFFEGGEVFVEKHKLGTTRIDFTLQLQDNRLQTGVFFVGDATGRGNRGILGFKSKAENLARAFNRSEIEAIAWAPLAGGDQYDRIMSILTRPGREFTRSYEELAPSILRKMGEEPGTSGYFTDKWTRIFQVR